ncbi:MAG: glutamine-synthetase adenylyltransferase, partial [Rhodospirillales bacterium]
MERWLEAAKEAGDATDGGGALAQFAKDVAEDPVSRRLLESVFGNSPFLTSVIVKDPDFTRRLLVDGPDEAFDGIMVPFDERRGDAVDEPDLVRLLRVARRQVALTTAVADITGAWPLEKVTGALSYFAEVVLGLVSAHVLRQAAGQGAFGLKRPDDPERESGLVVIAMGKLGARELNYSSDIDLIVFYDPDRIATDDPAALQNHFVRLTRNLVRLIEERTADGYVFRVDLRLRPDPGVTPLAISTLAAETYYESLGQNWERAAMIKARPVAG